MFIKKIELKTEEDTKKLAEKIAVHLKPKDIVFLQGDLGVGKTYFTRSLIRFLGDEKQEVPSPTFTLVQQYELPKFTLYHFDLYRIKHSDEIYELGWEDACYDGVVLVEWPENLGHLMPKERIEIELFFTGKGEERIATIKSEIELF